VLLTGAMMILVAGGMLWVFKRNHWI